TRIQDGFQLKVPVDWSDLCFISLLFQVVYNDNGLNMDTKDYDYVRNMALLFFLDRLMDKGQPRSLHDLSCQFGTKGFTKEMRQVAGGSQSGLRKFLMQYPSLFTVENDNVFVTCYSNSPLSESSGKNQAKQRDYSQEALVYFTDKMEQYGDAEVPVRSLLGHRSQAPPEVRHVSGQHMKEFKDFLLQYPDTFCVRGDNVLLTKNVDKSVVHPAASIISSETDDVFDTELTDQLISYFISTIENRGTMSVDQLFNILSNSFPKEKWCKVVKNSQDLNTFLKMNSKTFHVVSNEVSLVINKNTQPVKSSYNDKSPSNSAQTSPSKTGSIKQRVMSHVMKAMADNAAREYKDKVPYAVTADSAVHTTPVRVMKSVKVVTKVKDCQLVMRQISKSHPPIIAVDGEGVNVGPNGPLTLLQICSWDGQIYVFDVQTCPDMITDGGLTSLLSSSDIMKVMHDCRNDSAALCVQFDITLNNIFDTQAAHCVIQQQETGKPVYKVKNVSLNTLCKLYGGVVNPKREQLKKIYRRDPRYWSRRPLTDDMIMYAAYNVIALAPTIYEALKSLIKPESETLFRDLCHEQIFACINTDEIKGKKKRRKLEMEIDDLKLKLSASNKSVVLSNREIRLLRYIELSDEDRSKLEGSYKVA
ncbi:TMPRSS15 (predicted), partial [Pycnogonum litorale]